MQEFTLGFGTRIDGMITDGDLKIVLTELDAYCSNFEIKSKETSLSTYVDRLPAEYNAFMVAKKVAGRSEGTLKQYDFRLAPFLYHMNKPVKDITEADIVLYLYAIGKTRPNLGNRSIEHIRLILNSFFTWCHDLGYIEKNPMKAIQPIKYEKKEFPPIGEEAFERMRQSLDDPRDRAMFEVMYSSGCRVGELVNLRVSDVDLKNREVKLFGKGNKHRVSFISVRAMIALKDYLAVRPVTDDDHLFVGERAPHRGLSVSGVRARFKKHGFEMDVEGNMHPHRLRHQFATTWVNKGLPVAELQQILGHSNLRTTQEYYDLSRAKTKFDYMNYMV